MRGLNAPRGVRGSVRRIFWSVHVRERATILYVGLSIRIRPRANFNVGRRAGSGSKPTAARWPQWPALSVRVFKVRCEISPERRCFCQWLSPTLTGPRRITKRYNRYRPHLGKDRGRKRAGSERGVRQLAAIDAQWPTAPCSPGDPGGTGSARIIPICDAHGTPAPFRP